MSDEIVKLVNEFAQFDKQKPNATMADFCRYYLAQQQEPRPVTGGRPPSDEGVLLKTMGRLLSISSVYHDAAMAETALQVKENFYMLNWLKFTGEAKKTEFVSEALMGYTTGMDAVNRMIKEGFVQEREHDTDKRAKLISITQKGLDALMQAYPYMQKCAAMLLKGMHPEAIKLCASLLADAELHQSAIIHQVKGKPFPQMYEEVMRGA